AALVDRRARRALPRPAAGQAAVRVGRRRSGGDRLRDARVCYPDPGHPRPDDPVRPRARELRLFAMTDAYDFFREGQRRLRAGLTAQATVPLEKAKRLEPQKA